MKRIHFRSRARGCRHSLILWSSSAALCLSVSTAQAQLATIKGTVQTQTGEKAENLTVRVLRPRSHALVTFKAAEDSGEYKVERLLLGKYDIVACGLAYKPDLHPGINVQADVTIDFLLGDPTSDNTIQGLLQGPQEAIQEVVVFLRHSATGCVVAQAITDKEGQYEFKGVEAGEKYDIFTNKVAPKEKKKRGS